MPAAEIGVIGLGVMGANLALNISDHGYEVAVYNRTVAKTRAFMAEAGALSEKIIACDTLEALVDAIRPPRPIILMIKAGDPVDQQIAALQPLLDRDDLLIDAGNANFRDTIRRFKALEDSGPTFLGMGVSGGEEGARHGPSIMVGGKRDSWQRIEDVLTAISAKYEGEPCAAWVGEDGAGHFVKTIHNGIEYADMQMIAEIYGIMRDGMQMEPAAMAGVFAAWNDGPLDSYLIEITADILQTQDDESGKPMVDMIVDAAGQKGTGRWSAIESLRIAAPAPAIEAAVGARSLSAMIDLRTKAEAVLGVPGQGEFDLGATTLDLLEKALLAGKVAAYAQGFSVMAAASKEYGWHLPLPVIARIWRAGCIIRSRFLDDIASAFTATPDVDNLLLTPEFAQIVTDTDRALRAVLAEAIRKGQPVPALASAVAYFDQLRRSRGTANLIQAQRDYFGAHGFVRTDAEGEAHGPWHSEE
ncbi:NADP-dependent phosphogluconate dehydrogenase [Pseudohoeflea coraliihabitans]|uniref:6-phosphogluconate dehydrogenase, decarboxylating n=1 Tax=Pseudohoeflea coraliihabitans TaxID=2860393 RepID=A0ABS6WQI3_9HYPH|nr:NADP-dependent phosphogluconate dehydrogenase [Pseudohoeflea sp. DP4N28-3]MBW3097908.1 NADP-dependent phosphogluconate dehydrogenase [Pseudohoeflea sp. DP4N28-3]